MILSYGQFALTTPTWHNSTQLQTTQGLCTAAWHHNAIDAIALSATGRNVNAVATRTNFLVRGVVRRRRVFRSLKTSSEEIGACSNGIMRHDSWFEMSCVVGVNLDVTCSGCVGLWGGQCLSVGCRSTWSRPGAAISRVHRSRTSTGSERSRTSDNDTYTHQWRHRAPVSHANSSGLSTVSCITRLFRPSVPGGILTQKAQKSLNWWARFQVAYSV